MKSKTFYSIPSTEVMMINSLQLLSDSVAVGGAAQDEGDNVVDPE